VVKRITISVSDEFSAKMEKVKGRVNVSEEFRKHMTHIMNYHEKLETMEGGEMEKIIERLRHQKQADLGYNETRGREKGLEWAMTADYMEIQAAMCVDFDPVTQAFSNDNTEVESINDYLADLLGEEVSLQYFTSEQNKSYYKGWQNGVFDFWDKVKDKI